MANVYYAENIIGLPRRAMWRLLGDMSTPIEVGISYVSSRVRLPKLLLFALRLLSRAIRKLSFANRVSAFLLFCYLKRRGWRLPAQHGVAYPTDQTYAPADDLPGHVLEAIGPLVHECQSLGLVEVGRRRWECIGPRQEYAVVYLDPSGYAYVELRWRRASTFGFDLATAEVWCTSNRDDGSLIRTVRSSRIVWRHKLFPRTWDIKRVKNDLSIADLLGAHRKRIRRRSDLMAFDSESLAKVELAAAQELVEHWVGLKLYVPLSDAEVEALEQHGRERERLSEAM